MIDPDDLRWTPLPAFSADAFGPLARLRAAAVQSEVDSDDTLFESAAALGYCRRTGTAIPAAEDGSLLPEVLSRCIQVFVSRCRDIEGRHLPGLVAELDDDEAWAITGPEMAVEAVDALLDLWYAEYAIREALFGAQDALWADAQGPYREADAAMRARASQLVVALDTNYLANVRSTFSADAELHWLLQDRFVAFADDLIREADESTEELRRLIHGEEN